jgi:hypothetical protein
MKQVEEVAFAAVLFIAFAMFVVVGWGYSDIPRTVPLTVSIPGLVLAAVHLAKLVRARKRALAEPSGLDLPIVLPDASEGAVAEMVRSVASQEVEPEQARLRLSGKTKRILGVWAWIVALAAGIDLLGFLVASPIFLCTFIRFVAKRSWAVSAGIAACFTVAMYLIFYVGLKAQL